MSDIQASSFEANSSLDIQDNHQKITPKPMIQEVYCPSGSFTMGKGSVHKALEYELTINRPIYMADTMVSQALWSHYCDNSSNWRGLKLPVERVSWLEAVLFCNMLSKNHHLQPCYQVKNGVITFHGINNGYRLPFEAEWEYCARSGGLDYEFAGSDNYGEVCLKGVDKRFINHTIPLKQAMSNEWGLFDMTGNLNEWCNDLYRDDGYLAKINPKTNNYIFDIVDQEFTFNLMEAREFSKFNVVTRGGSWFNSPDYSKVHSRHMFNIMYPSSMVGIRLVRNA